MRGVLNTIGSTLVALVKWVGDFLMALANNLFWLVVAFFGLTTLAVLVPFLVAANPWMAGVLLAVLLVAVYGIRKLDFAERSTRRRALP